MIERLPIEDAIVELQLHAALLTHLNNTRVSPTSCHDCERADGNSNLIAWAQSKCFVSVHQHTPRRDRNDDVMCHRHRDLSLSGRP